MITSAVKQIGGEPIVQTAYITYLQQYNCYQDFADCGYRLFSVSIPFATCTINEIEPFPALSEDVFKKETPDFEIIDESVKKILDACPDALIFPRISVNLPMRWEGEHSDELCYGSYGEHKCVCFASSCVCVYADRPYVVHASKLHLFLHTADEGEYNFKISDKETFVDIFTPKNYLFPCHLKAGQSLLFEIK